MIIYTHPACLLHDPGPEHPERPARLEVVLEALRGQHGDADWREAPIVKLGDLRRVHDDALVHEVLEADVTGYRMLDPDTVMCPASRASALRAAVAGVAAVDAAMSGEDRAAFCAVRPPGHHAETRKAMGFCFCNSIAVGAMHAIAEHGIERVAILDFDVHHGNGTEEIFKNDERVMLLSLFQHPFFPYCGDTPIGNNPNIVNTPLKSGTKGEEVREVVADLWRYKLEEFQPQIIFISAGFDGHLEDDMGNFGLVDADYKWITERIVKWAQTLCDGRIVSVLEGGYELSPLSRSVAVHVQALVDA